MYKVPRAVFEMEESLMKSRALLHRLEKGQNMLQSAVQGREISKAVELAKLFNEVALEVNNLLENAQFMHETLTTGKTTVLNRKGKPVTTMQFNPNEHQVVDLWTLKSVQRLKEVFGEENIKDFEIVP